MGKFDIEPEISFMWPLWNICVIGRRVILKMAFPWGKKHNSNSVFKNSVLISINKKQSLKKLLCKIHQNRVRWNDTLGFISKEKWTWLLPFKKLCMSEVKKLTWNFKLYFKRFLGLKVFPISRVTFHMQIHLYNWNRFYFDISPLVSRNSCTRLVPGSHWLTHKSPLLIGYYPS